MCFRKKQSREQALSFKRDPLGYHGSLGSWFLHCSQLLANDYWQLR